MTKLSVNLNKIALLRNQRDLGIPSVTQAAQTCIDAGCHGITVHPRPDQRHIRPNDVHQLAKMLTVEFNIEGNPYPEFMTLVRKIKPTQCTLVPDDPEQRTSDHGWDLAQHAKRLRPIIHELQDLGIRVSLFLDPNPEHIARAKETGADRIELYTEPYATAFANGQPEAALAPYIAAANAAHQANLGINAGHDLNLQNLPTFIQAIPTTQEVSIGHALTADALNQGLAKATQAYLAALNSPALTAQTTPDNA